MLLVGLLILVLMLSLDLVLELGILLMLLLRLLLRGHHGIRDSHGRVATGAVTAISAAAGPV